MMEKQWFVLQALSGQEFKAKENIRKRLQIEEMEDFVDEVLIPTEKVAEVKDGKKREITRKFYPGYMLALVALYDEKKKLIEKTWHFFNQTPGIIGFVGGEHPVPLPKEEVDSIMNQIVEKSERVVPKVEINVGEIIKINDGPFLNFNGEVEEVDPEHGKLKVSVSIFGRSTPVELEYWQVEKV